MRQEKPMENMLAGMKRLALVIIVMGTVAGCGNSESDKAGKTAGKPTEKADAIALTEKMGDTGQGFVNSSSPKTLTAKELAAKTKSGQPRHYPRRPTDETTGRIKEATNHFHQAFKSADKVAALLELLGECHPAIVPLVEEALADEDAEVRLAAMELLAGYDSTDVLTAAERGLKDADADVRKAAVDALAEVKDPRAGELLAVALGDGNEEVRLAAVGLMDSQPYDSKLNMAEKAIQSKDGNLFDVALTTLQNQSNADAVDILIQGYKNADDSRMGDLNRAMWFWFDQQFDDYNAAAAWWKANRGKANDNLSGTNP